MLHLFMLSVGFNALQSERVSPTHLQAPAKPCPVLHSNNQGLQLSMGWGGQSAYKEACEMTDLAPYSAGHTGNHRGGFSAGLSFPHLCYRTVGLGILQRSFLM